MCEQITNYLSVTLNGALVILILIYTQMKNKADRELYLKTTSHEQDLTKIKAWADVIADRVMKHSEILDKKGDNKNAVKKVKVKKSSE